MYIYNVTTSVEPYAESEWLQYMKSTYLPRTMATGLFIKYHIFRLLTTTDGSESTYAIQYYAESLDHINVYLEKHAPDYIQEHNEMFKNQHVAFRTLLEEVNI